MAQQKNLQGLSKQEIIDRLKSSALQINNIELDESIATHTPQGFHTVSTPDSLIANSICIVSNLRDLQAEEDELIEKNVLLIIAERLRSTVIERYSSKVYSRILFCNEPRNVLAILLDTFFDTNIKAVDFHSLTPQNNPFKVVGGNVHVAENVQIGEGSVLFPGVVLYPDVKIGMNVTLHAGVVIRENCTIGDNVVIGANSTIGHEGFGYVADSQLGLRPVPQVGAVVIGSNVDIGANTTIDRGTIGDTVIEQGVKIDNQVQIGHNVRIGKYSIICAQVGIAGSVHIEPGVTLAGKVGIADHLHIASGVRIGALSGVTSHVEQKGDYVGYPLMTAAKFRRFHRSIDAILSMVSEWKKSKRE